MSQNQASDFSEQLRLAAKRPLPRPGPAQRIYRISAFYRERVPFCLTLADVERYLNGYPAGEALVSQAYQLVLQRAPDPGGHKAAFNVLRSYGLRRMLIDLYISDESGRLRGISGGGRRQRLVWKLRRRLLLLALQLGFIHNQVIHLCRL